MVTGHVYILLNAAMPDMLKIGMTSRAPEDRARELSRGTGVAVPYHVAYYEEVPYYAAAEGLIHSRLAKYRVNPGREFFHLDRRSAIRELSQIAEEMRRLSPALTFSEGQPTAISPATESCELTGGLTLSPPAPSVTGPGQAFPAKEQTTKSSPTSSPPLLPLEHTPQPTRAAGAETQHAIIDAILGAFPYSSAGNWLSAKRQIELLQLAYKAKLSDGRNAFPAMHGNAAFGDAPKSWDGADRTNRMKHHVRRGLAIKAHGRNQYMLAEGVAPAKLGVSQAVVDALAAHDIIRRYDVSAAAHGAPVDPKGTD